MAEKLQINSTTTAGVNKSIIKSLLSFLKNQLGFDILSLAINFISNEEILEINKVYLGHGYTTDIITFNYSGDNQNLDGEIYIAPEVARNNADIYNVSLQEEIFRLVIHGILHLIGYDDSEKKEKAGMFELQEKLITDFMKKEYE